MPPLITPTEFQFLDNELASVVHLRLGRALMEMQMTGRATPITGWTESRETNQSKLKRMAEYSSTNATALT